MLVTVGLIELVISADILSIIEVEGSSDDVDDKGVEDNNGRLVFNRNPPSDIESGVVIIEIDMVPDRFF
jgi:hypothetical protein